MTEETALNNEIKNEKNNCPCCAGHHHKSEERCDGLNYWLIHIIFLAVSYALFLMMVKR